MPTEKRLQKSQIPADVLDEAAHDARDHAGVPGVGDTKTVNGANGIDNTGDNVNVVVEPVYGTGANEVAEGDHGHATLPTADQNDALDNANVPDAGNPFATQDDLTALGAGQVDSVQEGESVDVDATDPANPIVGVQLSATPGLEHLAGGLRAKPGTAIIINASGINVDLGATAAQAAPGDHTHGLADLSDVSSDEAAGFNAANAPAGANPFATIADVTASAADEKASVSANDTTPGFLNGKLVAGGNISLVENNDGANETLTIAATGLGGQTDTVAGDGVGTQNTGNNVDAVIAPIFGTGAGQTAEGDHTHAGLGTDEKASVSANDTTPGFLNGKLVSGTNISFTENNDGANETLTIDATGVGLVDSVGAGTAITIGGTAADPVVNVNLGAGASDAAAGDHTHVGLGTDEEVKVSANDTTPGYLNGKLVNGANITFTENNDGANETLTIAATGLGGQVDSVGGGTACTVGGTAVDPIVNVTLGTGSGQAAEGDHTHVGLGTDEKASVSANDTTPGYLNGKLVAGTNIAFTENNDGANETLTLNVSAGGQVDSVGAGTAVTIGGTAVDPTVSVNLGTGASDAAAGDHTHVGLGTDEEVKVSANDTTPGFLNGKLVAGTNISFVENNDGANETLTLNVSAGGITNTVAGANGCTNTGTNTDATIEPVYGTTANTVCEGDDSRLNLPVRSYQVAVGVAEAFTVPAYTTGKTAEVALKVYRNGKLLSIESGAYVETNSTTVATSSAIGDEYIFEIYG